MFPLLAEAGAGSVVIGWVIVIGLLAVVVSAVTAEPKKKSYDVRLGGKITER